MGKKTMTWVAALALGAGPLLVACGDDGDTPGREETIDELVSEGLSEAEATCFVDELGADAAMLWETDESQISEADTEKVFDAAMKCAEQP